MIKINDGFSLVEVMAAIVILTIAFFPMIAYFTNSIGFVSQREALSEANNIAVNTMEILKRNASVDWENLNNYSYASGITVTINYLDKNLNSDIATNAVLAKAIVDVQIDDIDYQLISLLNKEGD